MKETIVDTQIWSELVDIDIPGSVKINGIRYYTYDQALEAVKKFSELYGKEWRLPSKNDFITLVKKVNYDVDKLVEKGFVKGGWFSDDAVYGISSYGYYWSSTYVTTGNAYYLYFNSDGVYAQSYSNKYFGFAVRCVKDIVYSVSSKFLSVDQMKKLQELGLDIKNTGIYWNVKPYTCEFYVSFNKSDTTVSSVYTLQGVLESLPKYIEICDRKYYLVLQDNSISYKYLSSDGKYDWTLIAFNSENYLTAAYDMLCWYLIYKQK